MKKCPKCGEFRDELERHCKTCRKKEYAANPEKAKANARRWYLEHPEKAAAARKKYAKEHPEINKKSVIKYSKSHVELLKIASKKYSAAHPEKGRESSQRYREAHPDRIIKYKTENCEKLKEAAKRWRVKNREKANATARRANVKKRSTPSGQLNHCVSSAILQSLKRGAKRGQHWEKLVGYTVDQLKRHLEKQFLPGMIWENYGQWHVDHKIPIAVFNFEKPEDIDFKKCWALKNLQPLWAKDNHKKWSKITKPFQPALLLEVA